MNLGIITLFGLTAIFAAVSSARAPLPDINQVPLGPEYLTQSMEVCKQFPERENVQFMPRTVEQEEAGFDNLSLEKQISTALQYRMFSHTDNQPPLLQVEAWEGIQGWIHFVVNPRFMPCAFQDLALRTENQMLEVGSKSPSNFDEGVKNGYARLTINPVEIWATAVNRMASVNDFDSINFMLSLPVTVDTSEISATAAASLIVGINRLDCDQSIKDVYLSRLQDLGITSAMVHPDIREFAEKGLVGLEEEIQRARNNNGVSAVYDRLRVESYYWAASFAEILRCLAVTPNMYDRFRTLDAARMLVDLTDARLRHYLNRDLYNHLADRSEDADENVTMAIVTALPTAMTLPTDRVLAFLDFFSFLRSRESERIPIPSSTYDRLNDWILSSFDRTVDDLNQIWGKLNSIVQVMPE